MSEDHSLNLGNRVVRIHVENDQASSTGHENDPSPMLPEIPKASGRSVPPEPTLSELYGQMARMMKSLESTQMSLERSGQAHVTRLDSASAAVTASNDSIFLLG